MNSEEIVAELKKLGNERDRQGMGRFGINVSKAFGVSVVKLRKIAKTLGKNHSLAQELWATGFHEARLLAVLIDEPQHVSQNQMNSWVHDFDSWDLCDVCCANLFDKTPYAYAKVSEWSKSNEEFVRRAAFALLAALSVHDKKANDKQFLQFLPIIQRASTDDRNFVRKAVNWALRQIGKRNKKLNSAAIKTAKAIRKIDSKSARWIAADALKELTVKFRD